MHLQAKGAGKELGRNLPDPSAAADKAKGDVSSFASALLSSSLHVPTACL
jgi:hypothetical protein